MSNMPPVVRKLADGFTLDRECARNLDAADPLARFRHEFHIPKRPDGQEETYFCGDSLGLQPKRTAAYIHDELRTWRERAVRGHFETEHPWVACHERLADNTAALVGALPSEVVVMNSLTVNLHLMMVSFYRPTRERFKILIEDHAFPSDHYAVMSQLRFHGLEPASALVTVAPREGEELLRQEDLDAVLDREGGRLALVLLPGVQYYTGQAFDLQALVQHGHRIGAVVGFDLAHAAGNMVLKLHDWDVDFACWCTYKYLNSGPGSVGCCFVHERHGHTTGRPRLAGWWGHDKKSRFLMGPAFDPIPGAEGWQLSNPSILSLAAVRASLDVFAEAGGIVPLRLKSVALTGYLEFLLRERLGTRIEIVTPSDPDQRGCQVSIRVGGARLHGKELLRQIEAAGVACDFREPNAVRVAPVPLYNTFTEVYGFVDILARIIDEESA